MYLRLDLCLVRLRIVCFVLRVTLVFKRTKEQESRRCTCTMHTSVQEATNVRVNTSFAKASDEYVIYQAAQKCLPRIQIFILQIKTLCFEQNANTAVVLPRTHSIYYGRDPFNQNSDRSDREKRTTSKGGPVFSKLFRLDRTDPLSFGPKFPEILVEWIAPYVTAEMLSHPHKPFLKAYIRL